MSDLDWQTRQTQLSTPFFSAIHVVLGELNTTYWPTLDQLNTIAIKRKLTNTRGTAIRFVPTEASATSAMQYETLIGTTGEIPTRENWHDLLNALQWLSFPHAKAAINAQHVKRISAGKRSVERDVLTMFDESGIIVACADATLLQLIRDFQWRELFVTRRAEVIEHMRFTLIGHGLLEKSFTPFIGITAKAMLLKVEPKSDLDTAAAAWLNTEPNLSHARHLAPLPLLGIPGWDARNADENFYNNATYFRAGYLKNPA